jgi:inorganic pyrophosphatase
MKALKNSTLLAGMEFPHDFGFLPKALALDGDAIDVFC